jgi:hypothetical protein
MVEGVDANNSTQNYKGQNAFTHLTVHKRYNDERIQPISTHTNQ